MKLTKGAVAVALALLPVKVMAEDVIKLGLFNRDAAIIVAESKGFLKQEDIRVEINTVTDSPTLLRNLIKGNYDLILNNADNVIAWAEGQGEDPQKNDFVIFLGGSQGVDQKLVVAPGINDFSDASGAMMSMPDDDIQKRGFKVLAKSEDYVKHYARGLGATRRNWANTHEDLVVRFTRAMIRASDWVQDPKNKDEAIQLLLSETKNNKARAEAMYAQTISPTMGLTPRSRIDLEGIRTVLELREVAGLMKPPMPKPEKYVDERFYKKALATIGK